MSHVASETLETEQKIGTQTRPNGAAAAAVAAAAIAAAAASAASAAGCRLQASKTDPLPYRNTMALKDELVREAQQKSV